MGAALLLAACIDFAEPVIPDRRAPAVLNVNVRPFDTGVLQIDGSLSPGRDSLGFQRAVPSPFIAVNNFTAQPQTISEQGSRSYSAVFAIPRNQTLGPFDMVFPVVNDVGQLPNVRWFGLQKLDPDTVRPLRGEDVVLRLDTAAEQSNPPNRFRQWFVEIRAGVTAFRISGDGPVPLRLRIPAEFVPPSPDNRASVSLIYFQTAQLRSPPGTYLANVTLDTRLQWVIAFRTPPP